MKKLHLAAASAIVTAMVAGVAQADTIRFWTTENQPERLAKQQAMADDFNKRTGHTVEVIPVEEKDLGTRTTAAFAAGDLPDVIYHTLQYVLPWAEAGILDIEANDDVVDALQTNTFAPGAIAMAQFDGMTAAVLLHRPAMPQSRLLSMPFTIRHQCMVLLHRTRWMKTS